MSLRIVGAVLLLSVAVPAWTSAQSGRANAPQATTAQTDETLKDRIAFRLETNANVRRYDIDVKVANHVATLEGDVATSAQKAEAERLSHIDGIARVDSQIKVDPTEDQTVADRIKSGLTKTGDKITDAWITTKVKWFVVGDDALKGSNIDVDTKDAVVTLKGSVPNAAARARAVQLAKDTDGVKRVADQLTAK